jgi:hypothetical protein
MFKKCRSYLPEPNGNRVDRQTERRRDVLHQQEKFSKRRADQRQKRLVQRRLRPQAATITLPFQINHDRPHANRLEAGAGDKGKLVIFSQILAWR